MNGPKYRGVGGPADDVDWGEDCTQQEKVLVDMKRAGWTTTTNSTVVLVYHSGRWLASKTKTNQKRRQPSQYFD